MATLNVELSPPSSASSHGSGFDTVLESIFAHLDVGVVVFDSDLQATSRNEPASQLLGRDNDVVKALERAAFEQPLADWTSVLRTVLDTGQLQRFDTLCSMADPRRPRYLRMVIAPAPNAPFAPVLAPGGRTNQERSGLLLVEDVTARTSMEQRLAVSERLAALGQLAARVAHELNNPLDGILRYVNLARRVAVGGDAKIVEYLERARTGLMHMAEIVGALLQYSRTARAGLNETSLTGLIEEAIGTFGPEAAAAHVSVVCSFHEHDQVVVRGSSLFQVFCNLVKNAIEAMPKGGTLTIKTRPVDDELAITFEDTGVGLPPEGERIFEPFFTTKPAGKGTGLGLAVCKEVVERHGGRITAHNRPGGGAVFAIRLPRAETSDQPSAVSRRPFSP